MKCWICGSDKNLSGEHIAKASDLKLIFSKVTQKKPLFLTKGSQKNKAIGSIYSRNLTSAAPICTYCNNVRTAPHDRAWEKLSNYLCGREHLIKSGQVIKLNKVFPGAVKKSMLNVHLYFVKLFGCDIVEHNVPIDISIFSDAIMKQKPHPLIHLAISPSPEIGLKKHVSRTNLEMDFLDGKCMYACWFYIVGSVLVNVIYAEPTELRKGLIHAWNPKTISKCLHIFEV